MLTLPATPASFATAASLSAMPDLNFASANGGI
jgi:hypothetical protein